MRRAKEDLVFRKLKRSSARLRWVLEHAKHRRTATRQRGFCGSLPEQNPPDASEAGMPPENSRLEIVPQAASQRAPA